MTDLVNITVDSLVNDENFKNKLLTHMENIMKDGKITANDLPDLVSILFSVMALPSSIRQARRDSNPQPTVLETVALPVELLAYHQNQ